MITFETYWPLLLLATLAYFWWVSRNTLTDLNPRHLKLGTIVRGTIVSLLALALMQPVLNRTGSWVSVVYLLDVSRSVSAQAVADAIDWIEAANREGNPDHARFIPFAASSVVFDDLDQLRTVTVASVETEGAIDQSATNLESALVQASRSFAPNHVKKLVLISDGNETVGTARDAIRNMSQENIHVFSHPITPRTGTDTWVEAIMVPTGVTQDELFPLEVHVHSLVGGSGELEVRYSAEESEIREVELQPGINRFGFEVRSSETGPILIEAEVRVNGDRFPENDVWRESVVVDGPPRVLYVEGQGDSAEYLRNALEADGIEVDVATSSDIGLRIGELDSYEAVVLSDVEALALEPGEMEVLATYVRDLGGGLVFVGGASVYGKDGYSETPVEEILPVRFDLEPPTVALVIVLDKSGSMGGEKLEVAKEASQAAVTVLRDDHLIGIVAFDYLHYWPVELRTAENRDEINLLISRIIAGGETNIYPALEEAFQALVNVDVEVKHVILLSDGRSLPDEFESLVTQMASESITVSTVAVGTGADRPLLAEIANWGHGRTYFIQDASRVPQIFTEEAELATQGTLREEPFNVVVTKEVEAFKGIDFSDSPQLLGYVATIGKDTAEILLESNIEKPVLARWQYGLGKSVAFMSDVKNRWAADWLGWEGYSRLWPQIVRETMRRGNTRQLDLQIDRVGNKAKISITAIEEDDTFSSDLNSQISVVDPLQNVSRVDLHHSGPGRYEAEVLLRERGPYAFRVTSEETSAARVLPYSYPDEYHFYPPDLALLEEASRLTGGKLGAGAAEIFADSDETVVRPTALWPYLAAVALMLYLVDMALRRMRLFESGSPPTEAPARRNAGPLKVS